MKNSQNVTILYYMKMSLTVVLVIIFSMVSQTVSDLNCDQLKSSVKCFSPNWEYLECQVLLKKNCVIWRMEVVQNVMVQSESSSDVQIFRTSPHLKHFTCEETLTLFINSSCCSSTSKTINNFKIVQPGEMHLKKILASATSIEAHIERNSSLHCYSNKIPLNYTVLVISEEKSSRMKLSFVNLTEIVDTIKVNDLVPHTKYQFFVKSQPTEAEDSSLWSPTLKFSAQTKSDVPPSPSISHAGFSMTDFPNSTSLLSLHWSPLPADQHNGPTFRYLVTITDSKSFEESIETKLTEAKFLVPSDQNITAAITSVNKVGEAHQGSTIDIPELSSRQKVSKVDAIVVDNDNIYKVYWQHQDNSGNITIFWCLDQCKNGVEWFETSLDTSVMTIPRKDISDDVYVAITDSNNISTGMELVNCIIVKEQTRLQPILEVISSHENHLIFMYHFSNCPSTNPSPFVSSYTLAYQKENTAEDASTFIGRDSVISIPHLKSGSCYFFSRFEITTMEGDIININYSQMHCTVPTSTPGLISAIVSESNSDELFLTLEPEFKWHTSSGLHGKSTCMFDIEGHEHIVDCEAYIVLPHSIQPSNHCPSVRTSFCSPTIWPPQVCSKWSKFYPIIKTPAAPTIKTLSIRQNSMLEVEYVTEPTQASELKIINLSTGNLASQIKPYNEPHCGGSSCCNYNNNIDIDNNNNSMSIHLDISTYICGQYNISVRCVNGPQREVNERTSYLNLTNTRSSAWSAPQTLELSCSVEVTASGGLVGIVVGFITATIVISILLILVILYIYRLRKRFSCSYEPGEIPLFPMDHERTPMFAETSSKINSTEKSNKMPQQNLQDYIPGPVMTKYDNLKAEDVQNDNVKDKNVENYKYENIKDKGLENDKYDNVQDKNVEDNSSFDIKLHNGYTPLPLIQTNGCNKG